eukprot:CAMPEP_0118703494 /NCGR_PEP_ID=MMETSP0800-20121206/18593_1 /TAXON_ID=210618 ORGANISM="Striatella unipunctata, Strain CCMP2910" /NCGR_SAMPLE_ID=MMETSP0800 /ASSEMBLY_ACC=CAM_ASM_000638 /LENGTH=278 /DNA_ID=CAMNT_0006605043 /DNA_START=25 /DNA_END=861 /DNA_ORIENTATION=+
MPITLVNPHHFASPFIFPSELETALFHKIHEAKQENNSNAVQVTQDEKQISITADVPGVKAQDIQVRVEENGTVLYFSAERNSGSKKNKLERKYHIRSARLDVENVRANIAHGVLVIHAPKDQDFATIRTVHVTAGPHRDDNDNDNDSEEEEESSSSCLLSVDVPGVKVADLQVDLQKGSHILKINAKRRRLDGGCLNIERSFKLDDSKELDLDKLVANLADGVLVLRAPRKTEITSTEAHLVPVSTKWIEEEEEEEEKERKPKKAHEIVVENVNEAD